MANYMAVSRTNYFQVTDEKKYEALFGNLVSEDNIHDFSFTKDGKTYHGFGSYGGIEFCTDPDDEGKILDILYGTFFLCGDGEDDLTDIPEELIPKYKDMFPLPKDN